MANALSNLYNEIKVHRKQMKNCQSAQDGEDVSGLINAFCDENFYKNDYQETTGQNQGRIRSPPQHPDQTIG